MKKLKTVQAGATLLEYVVLAVLLLLVSWATYSLFNSEVTVVYSTTGIPLTRD